MEPTPKLNQKQKLIAFAKLMRLDRPIGILLLLWPTMWAVWIASNGQPPLNVLVVFTLGVILMRSAGCIINDFADRKFDGHVARTKQRPLVTGAVSSKQAIILFVSLCLIAFSLVLTLNLLTIQLSILAVIFGSIYPFMKRYTHLPQFVLGIAWYLGIPMAFAAILNTIPPITWLIYLAAIFWTVAYDTMYAMADREDDLKIGVKSTAILFASKDLFIIGVLQIIVLSLLALVGALQNLNIDYYACLFAGSCLLAYQQYLIKDRQPQACITAFLNNNWFGALIFIGICLGFA